MQDHVLKAGEQTYRLTIDRAAEALVGELCSTPDDPQCFADVALEANRGSRPALTAIVFAALQRHHGAEFRTARYVDRLIERCGGFDVVSRRLAVALAPGHKISTAEVVS